MNTIKALSLLVLLVLVSTSSTGLAQESDHSVDRTALLNDIKWKTESQVRQILGAPDSIRGPIGTHASYQLWKYQGFSVAFSNNRAFHLFDESSLRKLALDENR